MLRVPGPSGTDRIDPIEMNRLCQRISLGSIPFVRVSRKTRLANLSKRCAYQVVPKETWKLKRSRGGKGRLPLARSAINDLNGRGGGIRTPDPLLPKQMRYQATLRPDLWIVSQPPLQAWCPTHSKNHRMRKIGARKMAERTRPISIRNTQSRQVCRRDWFKWRTISA